MVDTIASAHWYIQHTQADVFMSVLFDLKSALHLYNMGFPFLRALTPSLQTIDMIILTSFVISCCPLVFLGFKEKKLHDLAALIKTCCKFGHLIFYEGCYHGYHGPLVRYAHGIRTTVVNQLFLCLVE